MRLRKCDMKFTGNDKVAFIRLRVLAKSSQLHKLESSLLNFIIRSSSVIEFERCKRYDVEKDIGNRLGLKNVMDAINYLDAGSRLSLALLEDERGFSVKVYDAVHFICNMMNYYIKIPRADLEQFLRDNCGDLIFMP